MAGTHGRTVGWEPASALGERLPPQSAGAGTSGSGGAHSRFDSLLAEAEEGAESSFSDTGSESSDEADEAPRKKRYAWGGLRPDQRREQRREQRQARLDSMSPEMIAQERADMQEHNRERWLNRPADQVERKRAFDRGRRANWTKEQWELERKQTRARWQKKWGAMKESEKEAVRSKARAKYNAKKGGKAKSYKRTPRGPVPPPQAAPGG